MVHRTETTDRRHDEARRGETWRDVWARQLRIHGTGTSRMTGADRTKSTRPDGTTLDQEERDMDDSR